MAPLTDTVPVISVSIATKSHSAMAFCSNGRLSSNESLRISMANFCVDERMDGRKNVGLYHFSACLLLWYLRSPWCDCVLVAGGTGRGASRSRRLQDCRACVQGNRLFARLPSPVCCVLPCVWRKQCLLNCEGKLSSSSHLALSTQLGQTLSLLFMLCQMSTDFLLSLALSVIDRPSSANFKRSGFIHESCCHSLLCFYTFSLN